MRTLHVERWDAPASLPSVQAGEWRITHRRHEAGTYPMHQVNGYAYIEVEHDGRITQLQERRGKRWHDWMTDDPLFWYAMQHYARAAQGRVLVGGLGLGLVLQHLLLNPNVTEVHVIERQKEVAQLVWPHVAATPRVRLQFPQDFFDYSEREYDTVLTDFWVGSPHERQVQELFIKTFEHVNMHWPNARQFYHGLEPWAVVCKPLWDHGTYHNLRHEQKLGLLRGILS